jgi:hypothetical protein
VRGRERGKEKRRRGSKERERERSGDRKSQIVGHMYCVCLFVCINKL